MAENAPDHVVVVFCKDQDEVNDAVQAWVNVKKLKRLHTFAASIYGAHFKRAADGRYGRSADTPGDAKFVVVFGGGLV